MMPSFLARFALLPLLRGQLPALAGLVLPLAWLVTQHGPAVLGRLVLLAAIALFFQFLFARIRRQGFGLEGLSMATLVAMLVPETAPVWQLMLGGTFGVVIGLLIFGGHGRNIVHPAVATLTFLGFSFAGDGYGTPPDIALWTLAPALVLLLLSGQANWRLLLGSVLGFLALAWAQGIEALDLTGTGLFWLVLLYFVADPVASAATNWGRILQGLLWGALTGLFLQAGTPLSALVFAALMGSIFAPLLDQIVIALNMARRARRHG